MKNNYFLKEKEEKYQISIVKNSPFFDMKYYLTENPDIKNLNPAEDYLKFGWKKMYNPSKDFNTKKYLELNPECQICPLIFEKNKNYLVPLSIVAIMKNEVPYVKEWIDYHRLVGVSRFYIYDNESTDNLKEILQPYIAQGIVIYKNFPGEVKQMEAYTDCINNYKEKTKWLAIIDADEFIVPKKHKTILEFLKDYDSYSAIGINWLMFDSNNHKTKPNGGVLRNYTRVHCDEQCSVDHHIKSILKPDKVGLINNPHFALYKDRKFAVTENKEPINLFAFTHTVSHKLIQINHYFSKSYQEYEAKVNRGRADTDEKRVLNEADYNYKYYKFDYSIYKHLKKLYPSKIIFDTLKLWKYFFINLYLNFINRKKTLKYYFDKNYYIKTYPDVVKTKINPMEHYLDQGWKLGYNPSEKFNTNWYLNNYPDIKTANTCPLLHFLNYGIQENRLPLPQKKS